MDLGKRLIWGIGGFMALSGIAMVGASISAYLNGDSSALPFIIGSFIVGVIGYLIMDKFPIIPKNTEHTAWYHRMPKEVEVDTTAHYTEEEGKNKLRNSIFGWLIAIILFISFVVYLNK